MIVSCNQQKGSVGRRQGQDGKASRNEGLIANSAGKFQARHPPLTQILQD